MVATKLLLLLLLLYFFIIIIIIIIIINIIHLFNVDRNKIFTIKKIYIAVAVPLNDKDGMLIKVKKIQKKKKKKKQWLDE